MSTAFGSTLPRVIGDRVQFQQVIINLLINSIQATAQSGQPIRRIDIQTSVDEDGSVVFSVFDNGPGIAVTDLEHIFDGFFSAKDTGIGIGLAIASRSSPRMAAASRVRTVRTAAPIFASRCQFQRSGLDPRAGEFVREKHS